MAEYFIGHEILACTNTDLCYWARDAKISNAETDYLIEKQRKIIPIEVKRGKGGSLKRLHFLMETYPNVKEAFVFSDSNYGKIPEQKIAFIPLYYASKSVSAKPEL